MTAFNKKIILEDGSEYLGYGFGADRDVVAEIVFNTSMAGYQEIISDPSYTDQAIVMSYPLIGNYGIADEDFESKMLNLGALIVREVNDNPSNFRFTRTLSELLEEADVPGIYGIDTRKLVRSIRDHGSRKGKDLRSLRRLNFVVMLFQDAAARRSGIQELPIQSITLSLLTAA